MAMVITIMAIISFGTTFAYNSIMNNININKVVRNLTIDMVTAIQECKKRWGNDLTNCDTAAIVEFSSIGENQALIVTVISEHLGMIFGIFNQVKIV